MEVEILKKDRLAKILEIIKNKDVETQEELCEILQKEGYNVTQATVSRDIKNLGLIKVTGSSGRYKYAVMDKNETAVSDKLMAVFEHSFVSAEYANNIIVVKTLPGMAQGAASTIDSMKFEEVLGTIAGDDTILIVVRTENDGKKITDLFNKMAR